jgi:hypothetical protein
MTGFQIDMSPLERSTVRIGQSLTSAGENIMGASQEREQQQEQGDVEAFMRQAMDGDPVAFKELMVKSPQAARMVAEHIQSQQAGQQQQDDRFNTQIAQDTAGFIEQMHLAPQEQQESMFNAAIDDPRFDIDEEDRNSFMDTNARKAIIGKVKGKEYADNFFGAEKKLSSLQQKVSAEGLDPNTSEGQARAREINQGSRTDPSLKPSDQQTLNKANEGQLASASFATRVLSANENLAQLESTDGFDPTSIQTAIFEAIPGGNLVLSENEQSYAQSKRDFITAILRKESGAAIGADEFANEDRKFFPQVGDKPTVLKQKAIGRKRTFENLKNQSKGVFDIQNKNKPKTGSLSKAEELELQQLRDELGGQ